MHLRAASDRIRRTSAAEQLATRPAGAKCASISSGEYCSMLSSKHEAQRTSLYFSYGLRLLRVEEQSSTTTTYASSSFATSTAGSHGCESCRSTTHRGSSTIDWPATTTYASTLHHTFSPGVCAATLGSIGVVSRGIASVWLRSAFIVCDSGSTFPAVADTSCIPSLALTTFVATLDSTSATTDAQFAFASFSMLGCCLWRFLY